MWSSQSNEQPKRLTENLKINSFFFQLLLLFHIKNLHVEVTMLLVVFVNADFILNFVDITAGSTM